MSRRIFILNISKAPEEYQQHQKIFLPLITKEKFQALTDSRAKDLKLRENKFITRKQDLPELFD